MAIAWDQVIIENTLLAAIIVGSIYFERWLGDKAHRHQQQGKLQSSESRNRRMEYLLPRVEYDYLEYLLRRIYYMYVQLYTVF